MHKSNLLSLHLAVHVLTVCEREDTLVMLPKESHKKKKTLVHYSNTTRISSTCGVLVNFLQLLHFKDLKRCAVVRPDNFIETLANLKMN